MQWRGALVWDRKDTLFSLPHPLCPAASGPGPPLSEEPQQEADGQTAVDTAAHLSVRGAGCYVYPWQVRPLVFLPPCCSLGPENKGTPWASSRSASWGGEQGCSIHRRGPHSSGPSQAQRTTPGGTGRNARLWRWWVSQPGSQRGEVSEGLTLLFSPQSLPASKLLPPNKAEGSLFASGGFCSVYALLRGSLVLKRHLG